MSFPNHLRGQARVDKGREWGKKSAAKRKPNEPDWPEICKRGADAMRGQKLREGCNYTADGAKPWKIRRSINGQRKQVDLLVGDDWIRTGSKRTAESAVRWGIWKHRKKAA